MAVLTLPFYRIVIFFLTHNFSLNTQRRELRLVFQVNVVYDTEPVRDLYSHR
uniref:Uncharacterized protein n=1 Tax=Anguilla anguilla TaxID=7936 RepID=A0A0E9XTJ3_ANGAN